MNIAVPSRFACLKLEEDETATTAKTEIAKKKCEKLQQENGKKPNPNQKKKQNAKKEKKVQQQMQKQWEEWKEKDDKLVVGNYEQDLENALLLSKLHYEENKDKYVLKISDDKKTEKKNKKPKAMSLDQFLAPKETNEVKEEVKPSEVYDKDFFEKLQTEAKKQMTKEQVTEQRKERETAIDEIIIRNYKLTTAQYHEKLEVERKKNKELEKQLDELKEQMSGLRGRNQTLCTMLSTGEMKAKAEVLLELEKLTQIKNDLSEEVARLHGLLEQERSKVASLTTDPKHKNKK